MKKLLTLLVAFTLSSSCSSFTDVAKLPRNDVAGIAAATTAAVETPDLNLNGYVDGFAEWEAFIRTWVQTYQASKK